MLIDHHLHTVHYFDSCDGVKVALVALNADERSQVKKAFQLLVNDSSHRCAGSQKSFGNNEVEEISPKSVDRTRIRTHGRPGLKSHLRSLDHQARVIKCLIFSKKLTLGKICVHLN